MSTKQPKNFVWSILVPAIVSLTVYLVVAVVSPWAQRYWSQPAVKIVGVLPIHVHREISMAGITFHDHMLAVIFKVQNASSSAAAVSLAMLDGCAYIHPFVADSGLSPEEQPPGGVNFNEFVREREHAVQRVGVSGVVRDGTNVVPGYGTSYVGVLFPLELGRSGGTQGVFGSVSLDGSCSKLRASNPQPSFDQIFEWAGDTGFSKAPPNALRPEFRTGKLQLSLFIGTEQISTEPGAIKPIHSLSQDTWDKLLLPQMYENPEEAYPPRTNSP